MAFLEAIRNSNSKPHHRTQSLLNAGGWLKKARHRSALVFVAIFSILLFANTSLQAQNTSAEYKLKAVYIFNFIQYVDWPKTAFADDESPLIIGVLGNNPFGTMLDETVKGEVVKRRKLEVRRYSNVADIKECHVLFVSPSEKSRLKSILTSLKGRSILTVSDMEDFAVDGGIIRFLTKENKIGFRINIASAKAADLAISSKLLQISKIEPGDQR